MPDVTALLNALSKSKPTSSEELLSLIYEELRRLAVRKMAGERPGHILQPTALVHEAFLRLMGDDQSWENRQHFFAAASEAMRRILVEDARRRCAAKRGGAEGDLPLNESVYRIPVDDTKLLLVHEALDALESEHPAKAQIVKLRVFVGLTHREIAELLDMESGRCAATGRSPRCGSSTRLVPGAMAKRKDEGVAVLPAGFRLIRRDGYSRRDFRGGESPA